MKSAKKEVVFKLNGKPIDRHPLSPGVQRIKDFLAQCTEEDGYFTGDFLCQKFGLRNGYLRNVRVEEMLHGYTVKDGNKRYFACPSLIEQYQVSR